MRTLRSPCIQSDRIIIGIDLAKKECVAVAQTSDGKVSRPLKFPTNWGGFRALLAFGRRSKEAAGAKNFVVALEPTGHYGAPLVKWLADRGIEVMRVEALHTNRFKELVDGTRRKTDAKDAVTIAMLCRQGTYRPYRLVEESTPSCECWGGAGSSSSSNAPRRAIGCTATSTKCFPSCCHCSMASDRRCWRCWRWHHHRRPCWR